MPRPSVERFHFCVSIPYLQGQPRQSGYNSLDSQFSPLVVTDRISSFKDSQHHFPFREHLSIRGHVNITRSSESDGISDFTDSLNL